MSQVVNGNAGLKQTSTASITIATKPQSGAVSVSQPASGAPVAMVTNGGGDGPSQNGTTGTGAAATQQLTNQQLANTKEKTPMCLVNELARFNKIQHQYTLTDEQGPAHKKIFYVKLKLGDEEYAASGPSIKKAQHAGAAVALEKTQYKHPPPKPPKSPLESGEFSNDSLTPTVELNALAMKRGEPAMYRPIETPHPTPYYTPHHPMDFRGMYNQRYHYPKFPRVFYVSLKVGQREFIGEGNTRQAARHNAAAKALKVLRNLPIPSLIPQMKSAAIPIVNPNAEPPALETITSNGEGSMDSKDSKDDESDALKSEISLVHEIALKRNLAVNFEVTKESGPPHMRTFITRCVCGEFLTDGEGNSKKLSKKRAAEKMLDMLGKLPGLPPCAQKIKKLPVTKKKTRNLIKVTHLELQKASPDYGLGINPISRLIQIQQAKKEKEPVYSLIAERGLPRRREFVMQVTVGDNQCSGVGPNKKLAKRSAAEAMLQVLGYSRPAPQPAKPAIKSAEGQGHSSTDKKVTFRFMDTATQPEATTPTRQLVPGVIFMPNSMRSQDYAASQVAVTTTEDPGTLVSPQTTAAIAKELLDTGASPTAEAMSKITTPVETPATPSLGVVRPKQQLLYLANVLNFSVQFTDFPKGNKSEYLTLVSFGNNPPQVSHGSGATLDESHDQAARTALKAMAEVGLDTVAPSNPPSKAPATKTAENKSPENIIKTGAGDGPHIKSEDVKKPAGSETKVVTVNGKAESK